MREGREAQKRQVKELTERMEEGIREVFSSDRYREYLNVMSRFHNYSYRNQILILMQNPQATMCAGYVAWQNRFKRHVKKGERGIKILVPFRHRIRDEEKEEKDPDQKEPGNGTEENTKEYVTYQIRYVYDVSQTEGEPLPKLVPDISGDVQDFDDFMEGIRAISPVPIVREKLRDGLDGYYSAAEKRIVLRNGMSQVQEASAAVHELAHSILHDPENESEQNKNKSRQTRELEAESVSYVVCQYFGIDTSLNSFGYLASWSGGKDLTELEESLSTIRDTADRFISKIREKMQERRLERELKEQMPLSVTETESREITEKVLSPVEAGKTSRKTI